MNDAFACLDSKWTLFRGVKTQKGSKKAIYEKQLGIKGEDHLRPMTRGIASRINQLLAPLGFERREAAWNRKRSGLIDVVSMQVEGAIEKLTVEAGVLHPTTYATAGACALLAQVHKKALGDWKPKAAELLERFGCQRSKSSATPVPSNGMV